jgi:FkbM family methyltransferase
MRLLKDTLAVIYSFLRVRWGKFKTLLAWRYMLRNYWGERLRDYPFIVALKLLFSRFFFLTQIPLLLPDRAFLVNYQGAKLGIRLFSHPALMDLALGVYEYRKTRLFYQLVKEGMTIIDIGASEGSYSILTAKLLHDKGRVLAFEPDPDNCELLKENVKVNKFKSIEVHQYALSNVESIATFFPGGGLGSIVPRSPWYARFQRDPITVPVRKLDDVLSDLAISRVDVMKIDVEGSEILVLKGAEQTLRNNSVHLLMDIDVESNSERTELYNLLNSFGYRMYRIGKQLTPIRNQAELMIYFNNPAASTGNSAGSGDSTISFFESQLREIIPRKLLRPLGAIYYFVRPKFKKRQVVRDIYAIKAH